MITTPQNRVNDAIADSLPSPINHLCIPFVIVLAGLLSTVVVGGVGRLFKIGILPVNARVQLLNNVVRPNYAPTWQLQYQVQFLFPPGYMKK
jgi:hypothetical protein